MTSADIAWINVNKAKMQDIAAKTAAQDKVLEQYALSVLEQALDAGELQAEYYRLAEAETKGKRHVLSEESLMTQAVQNVMEKKMGTEDRRFVEGIERELFQVQENIYQMIERAC